ncbi:MAG TPA: hypothetical protein VMR62_08475 [Bryobacteraceae bacterium]|nr:hypothetical protein [Bryobacteraceae bacterium]
MLRVDHGRQRAGIIQKQQRELFGFVRNRRHGNKEIHIVYPAFAGEAQPAGVAGTFGLTERLAHEIFDDAVLARRGGTAGAFDRMYAFQAIAAAQAEHGKRNPIQQSGAGQVEVYDVEIVIHDKGRQR